MFTQNQTRQFYVVNDADEIRFKSNGSEIWLEYQPTGVTEFFRTDFIHGGMNTLASINVTYADVQRRRSKAKVITLKPSLLNSGNIINGQDYLVNINIKQYYFKSDLYDAWKHGVVHGAGNKSASDFYKEMALSLYNNFSREPWPILKFYLYTGNDVDATTGKIDLTDITWSGSPNVVEITSSSTIENLTGTYAALIIDEEPQDWKLGKLEQEPVIYDTFCDSIIFSGEEVQWGNVQSTNGNLTIGDGKKVADMEWFYHGERGDIYREYAYPNNFDNTPMVDPTAEYDLIDIHYYWQGANHAVQKSEKDITIACKRGETTDVTKMLTSAYDASTNPYSIKTIFDTLGVSINTQGSATD